MVIVGGRTDLLRYFHAQQAVAAARDRAATFVAAVPASSGLIMISQRQRRCSLPRPTCSTADHPAPRLDPGAGRPLAPSPPAPRIGLTEFDFGGQFLPAELAADHGESIEHTGAPGVSVRLVSDTGTDVPPGEVGEVGQRPHPEREYWNLPEATAAKIRDGWLRTGDLARYNGGLL